MKREECREGNGREGRDGGEGSGGNARVYLYETPKNYTCLREQKPCATSSVSDLKVKGKTGIALATYVALCVCVPVCLYKQKMKQTTHQKLI